MNRVVLCGQIAGKPHLVYTPCDLPVLTFRLHVPREMPPRGRKPEMDEIPCLAFGPVAVGLAVWGEPGVRTVLEGRLRTEAPAEAGRPALVLQVLVDYAYCAEPEPADFPLLLRLLLDPPPPAPGRERAA